MYVFVCTLLQGIIVGFDYKIDNVKTIILSTAPLTANIIKCGSTS